MLNVQKNDFSSILTSNYELLAETYGEELAVAQLQLEHDAYVEGEIRFVKNMERAIANSEFADHAVAKPLLGDLIAKVSTGLTKWFEDFESSKGQGARVRRTVAMIKLETIDKDLAAMLAVKTAISQGVGKNAGNAVQFPAIAIGHAIEDELRFGRIRDAEAAQFEKRIAPALAKRSGAHFKKAYMAAVEGKLLDEGSIEDVWSKWSREELFHVGIRMIELIIETTGMFELVRQNAGSTDDIETLCFTKEYTEFFTGRAFNLGGMSPVYQPCVIPPKRWTGITGGGYWSKGRRPLAFIRTGTKRELNRYKHVEMPKVYQAVNTAQETAWQVNKEVLAVLNAVAEWDNAPASLPTTEAAELPTKPEDSDTGTEAYATNWKKWKREAAMIYRRERSRQSQRISLEFLMGQANKFVDFGSIYFPHNLDWRGRAYAVPTFSPQGNDVCKGLLKFSDSVALPIGTQEAANWLAIHGANCMGYDKASLAERIQFVTDNEEMILSCAANPLDDTRWADQDAPWCFLAFCFEWAGYKAEGLDYVCSLPIAFDGTCSGLQHFSAMLRDEIGGHAVNLTPAATRQDIYGIVADKVTDMCRNDVISGSSDEAKVVTDKVSGELREVFTFGSKALADVWLKHGVTRSVTKRSVMTLAYGSSKFGFADQVREDTINPLMGRPDNVFEQTQQMPEQAARYMASHIWDSVSSTVVAAVEAMTWLQSAARLLSTEVKDKKTGEVLKKALPVTWVTPAGFPVWQEYRKYNSKRCRTLFLGTHNLSLTVATTETDEIDANKQKAGVAPNFVHSNDAAHLQLTVCHAEDAYQIKNLALVHDSFGAMPAQAGQLFKAVRESMVAMYEHNDVIADFYDQFADQLHESQLGKMPAVPAKGNLDIRGILDSEFAFS